MSHDRDEAIEVILQRVLRDRALSAEELAVEVARAAYNLALEVARERAEHPRCPLTALQLVRERGPR